MMTATEILTPQYHRKGLIEVMPKHLLEGVPVDAPSSARVIDGLAPAPMYVPDEVPVALPDVLPQSPVLAPAVEPEPAVKEPEADLLDTMFDAAPVEPVAETPAPPVSEEPVLAPPTADTRAAVQAPAPERARMDFSALVNGPGSTPAAPAAPVTPEPVPVATAPEPGQVKDSSFDSLIAGRPTAPEPTAFVEAPVAAPEPTVIYVREAPSAVPAPAAPVAPVVEIPRAPAPAPAPVPEPVAEQEIEWPIVPDVPVQSLPDIQPTRSAPAKEPLFVWRGKPIGGGASAEKPKKEVAVVEQVSLPPVHPGGEVDPQIWFEQIMQHALDIGASDLHITLDGEVDELVARLRIDGQMEVFDTVYGNDARTIMGKFKTAAGLASGGNFVPEESLYAVNVDGEVRKARVALFHTNNGGDALVLRLPPTGELRALEELEFAEENLALFHKLLRAANRMVLIAGPMGSGKTTTAHAALKQVSSPERAVWSVEDPVERELDGITQLEIDDKNGAGFEALLPSLVRADYDTLFLGEIRDKATASAAVRQSKAGRQVLTTIHANNNVTALLRLIELAQDSPLSVMDAVLGVVSQRLVRRLNPDWDGEDPKTKYKGRVPVHEVLLVNDALTEAIMRDRPISEIKELASAASESTFERDAERLVNEGITDMQEIRRVLGE